MITWIQDNLLEHLNIYDEIHIPDSAEGYCCDAVTRISILDQSNKDSTVKLFKTQSHDCCTCFCEFPGEDLCLLTCLHPYCVDCIATLIVVQFDSGRYCNMNCSLCDTFVGRDTIEQFMEKAKFPIWEERFLMQSVEEIDMVLFCPRCNGYAVRGEDNLDTCASCQFIFCDRCNSTWHPGECETFEHVSGIPSDEATAEKGEAKRLKAVAKKNEKLTQLMKRAFLKPCPKCRCWVMRDTGCNHMKCALCKTDFCYICGRPGGYGCCEYEAVSVPNDMEDLTDLQAVEVGRVNLIETKWSENIIQYDAKAEEITKCPKCKSKIQRIDGNNHGNCIVCKTQFCFLCLTVTKGTGHFQSRGCRQHGGPVKT
ncbi:E3 ubiquitin-protein ligase RNF14-like [Bolinopsis microptera]|uniref:E3 ubiquitin-protein ligase RNF14-like n=1 Tax=Bolinopsis microptera TaxID=2820187 RepID=UPI00307A6BCD